MTQNSRRQKVMIAVVLSLFVLMMQAGLMAQNLGTAPQVNVAVQGQQGTQPEGTFLNLINWIGNVIAPVGAGGAALMAIGSFAMGRGFGKWVFTAIGLLMVSGVTRLLEFWIAQGTGGGYLDYFSRRRDGGDPVAPASFLLEPTIMAPPQLITDFMRVMLLLAPSAAIICLVLAGLSLRQ